MEFLLKISSISVADQALLFLLILILFLGTGCRSTGQGFWEAMEPGSTAPGVRMVGGGPADIIPRSKFEPTPPDREVWSRNLDGSKGSVEIRRTESYGYWVWDPSIGKMRMVVRQETRNYKSQYSGLPAQQPVHLESVQPVIPKPVRR